MGLASTFQLGQAARGMTFNPATQKIEVNDPSKIYDILARYPVREGVPPAFLPYWEAARKYQVEEETAIIPDVAPVNPDDNITRGAFYIPTPSALEPASKITSPLRIPLIGHDA